ncbi:MAG: acyltransferase family protein [Nocardioides sp.]|uniref:acyltransferase family protein n=1 Tax=Nocardioides sp. TaxID=35761 RepID=UPI0039E382A1
MLRAVSDGRRAAAPYVGDQAAGNEVETLFTKQNGIQTVRGLGMTLVALHHMTGRLTNAAAVFDAFFVISGYLISIRLIMLAQTASIRDYFVTFYTFRVRRILPVAVLTLVLTAVVAHLIYLPTRAHDSTVDVLWAFFFLANVHFAADGTDYFHMGGVVSPVLNFWSLSVEEQFYLAWPLVILIALWVARRRGRGTGVTPVALVIIVTSYAYGWWASAVHPTAAYFSTFARVWDFGIGALMANVAVREAQRAKRSAESGEGSSGSGAVPLIVRVNRRLTPHAGTVAWVGIGLFLLALFFTPPIGYPVPAASFGMVGMGVIFYANTLKRDPSWLFANAKPFIWLGDMSYSLYAVHFPVIVFASSYIEDTALLYAFDISATLALTVLMYNFVEVPARRSWSRTREWFRTGQHQRALMQAAVFAAIAAILFAAGTRSVAVTPAPPVGGTAQVSPSSSAETQPTEQEAPADQSSGLPPIPQEYLDQISPEVLTLAQDLPQRISDPDMVVPTADLADAIERSVTMTRWPRLSNGDRVNRQDFIEACNDSAAIEPPCVAEPASGVDPAKVAVGVGDSSMLAYWPMLRDALVPRGWTVVIYGFQACTAALVQQKFSLSNQTRCAAHHDRYQAVLDRWKPSLVFMSDTESSPYLTVDDDAGGDGEPDVERAPAAYAQGLTEAIARAQGVGARAVVLSPPPLRPSIATCHVAGSSPQQCVSPVYGLWPRLNTIDRDVVAETGATYADLLSFFCHDLRCPAVVGDTVVASDALHLTPEYAAMLAPSFSRFLTRQGLVE